MKKIRTDEEALVKRAQAGDKRAVDLLLQKYELNLIKWIGSNLRTYDYGIGSWEIGEEKRVDWKPEEEEEKETVKEWKTPDVKDTIEDMEWLKKLFAKLSGIENIKKAHLADLTPEERKEARRKVPNEHENFKDIIQEIKIKVAEKIHQLKDPKKFRGWLSVIARNTYIGLYRKDKKWKRDQFHAATEIKKREIRPVQCRACGEIFMFKRQEQECPKCGFRRYQSFEPTITKTKIDDGDGDVELIDTINTVSGNEIPPDERAILNEQLEILRRNFSKLTKRHRTILVLWGIYNYSPKQIVELSRSVPHRCLYAGGSQQIEPPTGMSLKQVYNLINYGERRLRKLCLGGSGRE